jgi:DnaJ family protein C protein 3
MLLLLSIVTLFPSIFAFSSPLEARQAGDAAFSERKYDEALKHYAEALSLAPDDSSAAYKRALCHASLAQKKSVLADVRHTLEISPNHGHAALLGAKTALALGRPEEALSFVTVSLEHLSGASASGAAEVRQSIDRYAVLAKDFDAVQAKDGAGADCATVSPLATQMLALAPEAPAVAMARARCALAAGDAAGAMMDAMVVLKSTPGASDALLLRARAFMLMGEEAAAAQHLRQCVKFDPDHKECKKHHKVAKKLERAVKAMQEGMEAAKHHVSARFGVGGSADNVPLCEAVAAAMGEEYPFRAKEVLTCRCFSLAAADSADHAPDAVTACNEALQGADDPVPAFLARARALRAQGRFDEALRDYTQAKQRQPRSRVIHDAEASCKRDAKAVNRIDYYALLGVERTAVRTEIRRAYKLLALKYHPDSTKMEDKEESERLFMQVGEAWAILGDEEKRKMYDSGADAEEIAQAEQQKAANQNRQGGFNPFGQRGGGGGGGRGFNFRWG